MGVIALPEGVSADSLMGRLLVVTVRSESGGLVMVIGTLNPFREIGR